MRKNLKIIVLILVATAFVISCLLVSKTKIPAQKKTISSNNSVKIEHKKYVVYLYTSSFSPDNLNIKINSEVVWINKKGEHELYCFDSKGNQLPFDILFINPGDKFNYLFSYPGTFYCYDKKTPSLKLKIKVSP